MAKRIKVAVIGGGSYKFAPKLVRDIMLTPGLEGNTDFRLLDINLEAARLVATAMRRAAGEWGVQAEFLPTKDQAKALDGVDVVIITIATGDLDAMHVDVHLPERYGIFQTVGDTVGPGGWCRSLRNVPVFAQLGRQVRKYAPKAAILNYSNPMAVLTQTLCTVTDQPVVGLCHGLFETYDVLKEIFGVKTEEEIRVNFAGLNHFFWVLDLNIRGADGYALLARKMKGGKTLDDLVRQVHPDQDGWVSSRKVASELLAEFGKLSYVADRHTAEFFSHYLAPDESKLAQYNLKRTSVQERRKRKGELRAYVERLASGKEKLSRNRSRETAADITAAYVLGRQFIDVVNVPNRGQVPNLPMGAVLETLGAVNQMGFLPLTAGALPQKIVNVVLPHVVNANLLVQAGLEGDSGKAFDALINDPLCAHLSIPRIRKMGRELIEGTRQWLPRSRLVS